MSGNREGYWYRTYTGYGKGLTPFEQYEFKYLLSIHPGFGVTSTRAIKPTQLNTKVFVIIILTTISKYYKRLSKMQLVPILSRNVGLLPEGP
jgi:hypothetical protein